MRKTLANLFAGLVFSAGISAKDAEPVVNLIYSEKGLAGKQIITQGSEFEYSGSMELGWNNRRLKIDESLKVNGDGYPIEFRSQGTSAFGSKIDESFEWRDGVAKWNSTKDDGEINEQRKRFYIPADGAGASDNQMVKALLASPTQSIELFPSGTAQIRRLDSVLVENESNKAKVHLYATSGLGFNPDFAWYDEQGNFFAKNIGGFMRIIRDGFSLENFDALTKRQDIAEEDYFKNLAKELSHDYEKLLIKDAKLVDVENSTVLESMDVLLHAGKVVKVAKGISADDKTQVINAKGKTLIPGLWDMHGHLSKSDGLLNIAAGVTSVRDIGNNHDNIMQIESLFDTNTMIGTRVYRAGFMDQESEYSAGLSVKSLEEALETVDWFADNGYLQVKLYSSIDPKWVEPIAKRAHNRGMRLSGHIPAFMTAEQAVKAGYDEIQHVNMLFLNFLAGTKADTRQQVRFSLIGEKAGAMNLQSKEVKNFIQLLADERIVIDPTVATFRSMLLGERKMIDPEFESVAKHLPPSVVRGLKGATMNITPEQRQAYNDGADALVDMIKVLYDAGVKIVPGTDHIAGFTLHRELELYAQAGIPNIEVLKIASLGSAQVVGVAHQSGSITEGKFADLVLVDGDPVKNMADIRKVELVVKGNHYYQAADLHKSLGVTPFIGEEAATAQ